MESIRKKAGYLDGLLSAMNVSEDDPNGMFMRGVASLLGDLAERVETLEEQFGELNDYVESIDDDLMELEGIHDDEDDLDIDLDDEFFDSKPDEPFRLIVNNEPARVVRVPVVCPECGKAFLASGLVEGAKYTCPVCKEIVAPKRMSEKNAPIADPVGE